MSSPLSPASTPSSSSIAPQELSPRRREELRKRLSLDCIARATLQNNNSNEVRRSRFFTYRRGGPKIDARFNKLFKASIAYMRVYRDESYFIPPTIVLSEYSSEMMMRCLNSFKKYSSRWTAEYEDQSKISSDLCTLFIKNNGLYHHLHTLLKKENRDIKPDVEVTSYASEFRPQERDFVHICQEFILGASLLTTTFFFPKFGDKIKDIYARLLAIAWLEQDIASIKKQLGEGPLPPSVPIPSEFPFQHGGERYVVSFTKGDGACAMHALLGERIHGEYQYRGNVRKLFADTLTAQKDRPHIQPLLARILKNHFSQTDGGRDPSSSKPLLHSIPSEA